jgi:outer membrane protein OmpA-like peptidoglycan-associated protein
MCKALEVCQRFNIVHRDIKPENIFVSDIGDFKLGDFGIARTVEKTSSGLSKKGTYTYMAPEVYRGEAYNSSIDMYSLGLVLYRLLNNNRTPFFPAYPNAISHNDREKAIIERMSGAQMPAPQNADGRLAEIVLKACSYDPRNRFSSPMQMREELAAISYGQEEALFIYPKGDEVPIYSVDYVSTVTPPQMQPAHDATESLYRSTPIETEIPAHDSTTGLFGNIPVENIPAPQDKTESLYAQPVVTPDYQAPPHHQPSQPEHQAPPQYQPSQNQSEQPQQQYSQEQYPHQQYPQEQYPQQYQPQQHAIPQQPIQQVASTYKKKKTSPLLIIGIPSAAAVIIAVILLITFTGRGTPGKTIGFDPEIQADDTEISTEEVEKIEPPDLDLSIFSSSSPPTIDDITGIELGVLPSATVELGAIIEGISNSRLPDSIMWGEYTIYDIYDIDDFVDNMRFETVKTWFHDNDEITVLPFSIVAGTRNVMLREVSEKHPDYNWIRVGRFSRASKGQGNDFFGPNLGHYFETHIYHIDGDSLFLGWLDIDGETGIATIERWDEIKLRFDGRDLILSRDGATVKLLTYRSTDSVYPGSMYITPYDPGTSGWVSDLNNTFHGISELSCFAHGGLMSAWDAVTQPGTTDTNAMVRFVDGGRAVNPIVEFFEDGTLTIRWSERIDRWGSQIPDEVNISTRHILSHLYGMILIENNQLYFYQASVEEYNNARLGDNLAEIADDLDEEEVEELIRTQSNVLEHLQTAFSHSGINADIDPISGRVTLDSSLLFGVNETNVSNDGQAYLDGFLEIYAAVVLNSVFVDSIAEIIVEGHTCSDGSLELNQRLSDERAAAVADYCLSIQPDLARKMVTRGLAFEQPILDADGNEDKPASRRVTFRFILST